MRPWIPAMAAIALATPRAKGRAGRQTLRIKYGAPTKTGQFRWLRAGAHSEISAYGTGYSYTLQEQLDQARREAAAMVRVFKEKHPDQGWVVGIFQGRKLLERFPVDTAQGRRVQLAAFWDRRDPAGRQAVDWSRITPAQCEKLDEQIKNIQWRLWTHAADRLRGRIEGDRRTWSERAADRLDRARYHLGEARYLLRSDSDGTLDNWERARYDSEWISTHTAGYECPKPPCRPVSPSVRRKMLASFVSDTRKLKQISRRLAAVETMSSQRSDNAWRWVRWRPAYAWEAVNRITRAIEIIEPCVDGVDRFYNASCVIQSSLDEA